MSGLNPNDDNDATDVVESEYSHREMLRWAIATVASVVDLASERRRVTRDLTSETLSRAEHRMVEYTALRLGIRCAVRGAGFYMTLNAEAAVAEVLNGRPPRHHIVVANVNVVAKAQVISEVNERNGAMMGLMASPTSLMRSTQLARKIFGANDDQVALWFFGATQIGKSTFLEMIAVLLAESEVVLIEHWQYAKVTEQVGLLEPLLRAIIVVTNERELCRAAENGDWNLESTTPNGSTSTCRRLRPRNGCK